MRNLLVAIGLACSLATSVAMARAIPDPSQKPAPGNENPQTPIAQAGYSNATNYQLQCAGCHLSEGEGSPANDTPRMTGFVGNFLKVPGGREFLVRVPGMAQSALTSHQLADLLNWLLSKDGIAGPSMPDNYIPYTPDEVAAIRHDALLNQPQVRADLIERMLALDIDIDDGM
jgi:hypothetical protein